MNLVIAVSAWTGGGTERYSTLLANAMRIGNHRPHLFIERGPIDITSIEADFESITWADGDKENVVKAISMLIDKTDAKLLHINLWTPWEVYKNTAELRNVPIVQTYHSTLPDTSGIFKYALWRPGRLYNCFRFLTGRLLPNIPLVCISRKNFDILKKIPAKSFSSPSALIFNGIPLRENTKPQLNRFSKADEPVRIIWVGSLTQRKDPLLAIKVAENLGQICSRQVTILIFGAGELQGKCERMSRQLANNVRVRLHGYTKTIPYADADLCLITSKHEGMPYTAIEAIAAGLPVVTTDCGATSEVTELGGGIVVKSRSPREIARAIAQICDYQWAKFHEKAMLTYKTRFRFEDFAQKTLNFYQRIGLKS